MKRLYIVSTGAGGLGYISPEAINAINHSQNTDNTIRINTLEYFFSEIYKIDGVMCMGKG